MAGSSKRRIMLLILDVFDKNANGTRDYLTCEVSHHALFNPETDVALPEAAFKEAQPTTPAAKCSNLSVFEIGTDTGYANAGHLSGKKLAEVQKHVQNVLTFDTTGDMLVGTANEVVFNDFSGAKGRPVIVLGTHGKNSYICGLTSKDYDGDGRVRLEETAQTNLFQRQSSIVSTRWFSAVPTKSVNVIGALSSKDQEHVAAAMQSRYSTSMTIIRPRTIPPPQVKVEPQRFMPKKYTDDLDRPIDSREDAIDVVARNYKALCQTVRFRLAKSNMYSLIASRDLSEGDFLAEAVKIFISPNSKSQVPETVRGVINYFAAAAVNKARTAGGKIRRHTAMRDSRALDEIDESEHLTSAPSADHHMARQETRSKLHAYTTDAAAGSQARKDVLTSIDIQAVEGPDIDGLIVKTKSDVAAAYRFTPSKGAELAEMSPAKFRYHRDKLRAAIEKAIGRDAGASELQAMSRKKLPVVAQTQSIA